jgi:hypothetical protein
MEPSIEVIYWLLVKKHEELKKKASPRTQTTQDTSFGSVSLSPAYVSPRCPALALVGSRWACVGLRGRLLARFRCRCRCDVATAGGDGDGLVLVLVGPFGRRRSRTSLIS